MGDRAVAAFLGSSDPGTESRPCTVFRSQWAGSTATLERVFEAEQSLETLGTCSWRSDGRSGTETVLTSLDYLVNRVVYFVSPGVTRVFQPLWFGLPLADGPTSPRLGALAPVQSATALVHREQRLAVVKEKLQGMVRQSDRPVRFALQGLSRTFGREIQWYSAELFWRLSGL